MLATVELCSQHSSRGWSPTEARGVGRHEDEKQSEAERLVDQRLRSVETVRAKGTGDRLPEVACGSSVG